MLDECKTFAEFANACVVAQIDYCDRELARMNKARTMPGNCEGLAALNLHPLSLEEIDARIAQLHDMQGRVLETHGPNAPATRLAWTMGRHFTERPCAAHGLRSYRYKGAFGWIMIGATDNADALREAARSLSHGRPEMGRLQVWDEAQLAYKNIEMKEEKKMEMPDFESAARAAGWREYEDGKGNAWGWRRKAQAHDESGSFVQVELDGFVYADTAEDACENDGLDVPHISLKNVSGAD